MKKNYSQLTTLFMTFFIIVTILIIFKVPQINEISFFREIFIHFKTLNQTEIIFYQIIFFLLSFLLSIFPVPGMSLSSILSGALFGFFSGVMISSISIALGNLIAFLVARYFFRDFIQKKYQKELLKFNELSLTYGAMTLFSLRAILVIPSFILNLVASLTEMKVGTFLTMTILGRLPLTASYAYLGKELMTITSLSELLTLKHFFIFSSIAFVPWLVKYYGSFIKLTK